MIIVFNRQYGSHFIIAPQARIDDGQLEMVQVVQTNFCKLAAALPFFFLGKRPPFGVTRMQPVKNAVIEAAQEILYHIDGEPRKTGSRLEITVEPNALLLWRPCYG